MKKNERLDALKILLELLQSKKNLNRLFKEKQSTPLVKEICFGVSRNYFKLEAIANHLVKKKPKDQDVWVVLLIGLYQLFFLRVPDYAVVKETVNLLQEIKKGWAKGFINGTLRTFCREQESIIASLNNNLDFNYNHPAWLVNKIKKDWPEKWQIILAGNNQHPPLTLRINTQSNSVVEYLEKLKNTGLNAELTLHSQQGIRLEKPCPVEKLPDFIEGAVSVQDEAAQLAPSLLDLKPSLRILDACCAPGGKLCHLLERDKSLSCFAVDIEPARLSKVNENLVRLKLSAELILGDAAAPKTWWDGKLFDRILLDAPCSATGVIRRHPDIKLLRTPEEIQNIVSLQHKLLEALWPLLIPGGILVYATCSILREENEQQIAHFIKTHNDCRFNPAQHPWGNSTGHGWQILPGEHNMDGFFYSQITKITP